MKILITSEFFLSGQSTHVLDLAKQLKLLGHKIQIVFTGIHSQTFYSYYGSLLKRQGIIYYTTKHQTNIRNIIRQFRPDIIHCHSSTIFSLTEKMASQLRIPFIVTCHGLGLSHPKYLQALSKAARLICVGVNSAKELMPLFASKIEIIPNGIDIQVFKPAPKEEQLTVYYIARIDSSKIGPLKQLAKAVNKIPELSLTVVGNWKPPLNQIEFVSWQTDLTKILAPANIVAACGRTAREAMASGAAVLLMNKRYDGLINRRLVNKANFDFSGNIGRCRYQQIYKDLKLLTYHPRQLRKIQDFSREYALNYLASSIMAEKTVQVYQQVIKENAKV